MAEIYTLGENGAMSVDYRDGMAYVTVHCGCPEGPDNPGHRHKDGLTLRIPVAAGAFIEHSLLGSVQV